MRMNSTLRDPSLKWGRLGRNWASSRKVEAASRDAVRTGEGSLALSHRGDTWSHESRRLPRVEQVRETVWELSPGAPQGSHGRTAKRSKGGRRVRQRNRRMETGML